MVGLAGLGELLALVISRDLDSDSMADLRCLSAPAQMGSLGGPLLGSLFNPGLCGGAIDLAGGLHSDGQARHDRQLARLLRAISDLSQFGNNGV